MELSRPSTAPPSPATTWATAGATSALRPNLRSLAPLTTIEDLTNDRLYQVRVQATSEAGPSDWSPIATGTPEAGAPDAPGVLTLTPGNGQLGVSWTEPATKGASIIGYEVEYRVTTSDSGVPWTNLDFKGTGTTHHDRGPHQRPVLPGAGADGELGRLQRLVTRRHGLPGGPTSLRP